MAGIHSRQGNVMKKKTGLFLILVMAALFREHEKVWGNGG